MHLLEVVFFEALNLRTGQHALTFTNFYLQGISIVAGAVWQTVERPELQPVRESFMLQIPADTCLHDRPELVPA